MDHIVALVPSIGVGVLFVVVMRAILHADRRERRAIQEFERESARSTSPSLGDNDENSN